MSGNIVDQFHHILSPQRRGRHTLVALLLIIGLIAYYLYLQQKEKQTEEENTVEEEEEIFDPQIILDELAILREEIEKFDQKHRYVKLQSVFALFIEKTEGRPIASMTAQEIEEQEKILPEVKKLIHKIYIQPYKERKTTLTTMKNNRKEIHDYINSSI